MLLVASMALLAISQVEPTLTEERSRIVVQGSGFVKTAPNVANLSYDVRGDGLTNDQAVAALVSKSAAIERALRSIDPALDIRSDTVRVQSVRPKDCDEEDYSETVRLATGECAIKGYVAVQDFTIRTLRVADAGTLVGLAGRRGAYNPKIEGFALADDQSAKRRAIANAMSDARVKADAVAMGTSAKVGAIIAVSLDNARDQSMDIVVTASSISANAAAERDTPISVTVNPTPVQTSAQVTVTYAITR